MLIPLALLDPGKRAVIKELRGGRGLIRRLLELGFVPGTTVEILKSNPGPILVSIRGTKVALGRGVAMKILVEVRE